MVMLGEKTNILQMNDSHAYLDIHQELLWDGDHARYQFSWRLCQDRHFI